MFHVDVLKGGGGSNEYFKLHALRPVMNMDEEEALVTKEIISRPYLLHSRDFLFLIIFSLFSMRAAFFLSSVPSPRVVQSEGVISFHAAYKVAS